MTRLPGCAVNFLRRPDATAIGPTCSVSAAPPTGGVKDVARIELPGGDLSQGGGLKGALLDADQAGDAVAATAIS